MMDCCKTPIINDHITGSPEVIAVNALLDADTEYVWEITDAHGNIYHLPFTSDENGFGSIDVSELPEGFINPYAGYFTVKVKREIDDCIYVPMTMIRQVECISVANKAGNTDKTWLGCPVPAGLALLGSGKVFDVVPEEEDISVDNTDPDNPVYTITDARFVGKTVLLITSGMQSANREAFDQTDDAISSTLMPFIAGRRYTITVQ